MCKQSKVKRLCEPVYFMNCIVDAWIMLKTMKERE